MTMAQTASTEPGGHFVEVSRVFDAPRDFVFDAFTRPELLRKWWAPEGLTPGDMVFEPRIGGACRFEMIEPGGSRYTAVGTVATYDPGHAIAFTWAWLLDDGGKGPETLVSIVFTDDGDGTRVTLTHSGFADAETAAQHERGWSTMFNRFGDAGRIT